MRAIPSRRSTSRVCLPCLRRRVASREMENAHAQCTRRSHVEHVYLNVECNDRVPGVLSVCVQVLFELALHARPTRNSWELADRVNF